MFQVHVLDMELMAVAGVNVVVERRSQLGLGAAAWMLIKAGLAVMFVLEPVLIWLSLLIARRVAKHFKASIVTIAVVWLGLYTTVMSAPLLVTEKGAQLQQVMTSSKLMMPLLYESLDQEST